LDNTLPKKIWFLWLQGIENAPLLVRKCYASWVKRNPGWEVVVLDENNIGRYLPQQFSGITKQALSDVLRINLLAAHGGVWVDATCFCVQPLDEWLYDNMPYGFFAFDSPGPDRMISSWFIAAEKYNYICSTYRNKVNLYWAENPDIRFIDDAKWHKFKRRLEKMNRQIWFSKLTTKILKVYPYFWFHFLFEQIYLHDENFKAMWDATPKLSADIPHTLLFAGIYSPLNEELKAHIDAKASPVYKLSWKENIPEGLDGTVAGYLFDQLVNYDL